MWNHKDPNLKSYRSTDSNGAVIGDGTWGVDWDRIEADPDGSSVGFSDPGLGNPTESNDLFTSGWSFGNFSTGQSYVYSVDGIHVLDAGGEYFRMGETGISERLKCG